MSIRINIAGVGGQGALLAAHVLAQAALSDGLDVKVSEIHGMAQRGGSVTTVVTMGEDVRSMCGGAGMADYLLSFDMLEALRYMDQVREDGHVICANEVICPDSVLRGAAELPQDMPNMLEGEGALVVNAREIARESGNPKALNTVMLGALANFLPISSGSWHEAISNLVPIKTVEANLAAFEAGKLFAEER